MSCKPLASLVVLCAAAFVACPGDFNPSTRRDGSNAVTDQATGRLELGATFDQGTPRQDGGGRQDGVAPADGPKPDSGGVPCSPNGTQAACDPVAQTGCGAGAACYVVVNLGTACVCPTGTKTEGTACNTTAECARGLGCAGDVAPGACRRFCTPPPAASTCGQKKCTPLAPFPQYGFCI